MIARALISLSFSLLVTTVAMTAEIAVVPGEGTLARAIASVRIRIACGLSNKRLYPNDKYNLQIYNSGELLISYILNYVIV